MSQIWDFFVDMIDLNVVISEIYKTQKNQPFLPKYRQFFEKMVDLFQAKRGQNDRLHTSTFNIKISQIQDLKWT